LRASTLENARHGSAFTNHNTDDCTTLLTRGNGLYAEKRKVIVPALQLRNFPDFYRPRSFQDKVNDIKGIWWVPVLWANGKTVARCMPVYRFRVRYGKVNEFGYASANFERKRHACAGQAAPSCCENRPGCPAKGENQANSEYGRGSYPRTRVSKKFAASADERKYWRSYSATASRWPMWEFLERCGGQRESAG